MSARALFELGLDFNDLFDEIYVLSIYFFIGGGTCSRETLFTQNTLKERNGKI